ncbi:MAG: hypothetical protein JO244_04365 [Solirubrobacterales bacterium]|nr:hypothetical protein [Solirubrobacterales bacterium]
MPGLRLRRVGLGAFLGSLALAGGTVMASAQTEAPGCPVHPPPAVRSARPGARAELVPGAPMHLLLCRYGGVSAGSGSHLTAQRRLGEAQQVRALAAELDRLTQATGSYSCPVDTGAAIYATFGYLSLPEDPVRVGLSGCRFASNGHVASFTTSNLLSRLKALVDAR